jgi:hypothetical protein
MRQRSNLCSFGMGQEGPYFARRKVGLHVEKDKTEETYSSHTYIIEGPSLQLTTILEEAKKRLTLSM